MKRLFTIIVAFLVLCSTANAFMLTPQRIDYKGTITGLRVSAVDGTAFIDGANASVTALADGNHSIEIYDRAGRFIKGVLKAAGSGETLSAELITLWQSQPGVEMTSISSFNNSITTATATTANQCCQTNILVSTAGSLLESTVSNYILSSGTNPNQGIASNVRFWTGGASYGPVTAGNISNIYATTISATERWGFRTNNSTNFSVTVSSKQVLTPSATGVTIVSAKQGAVYNWSVKNPSFTYNAVSYFVIIKTIR